MTTQHVELFGYTERLSVDIYHFQTENHHIQDELMLKLLLGEKLCYCK